MQLVPSFPALSEWLILPSSGTNALQWEQRKDKPMGRFFLALILFPPYSLLSSFPLVWIAFALDGIAITKDGMEGFPLYPNAALKKIGRDCERRGSRCS